MRRIYETISESEVPSKKINMGIFDTLANTENLEITMEGLEEYLDGSVGDLPEEAKNSSK